ncbi:hypothetical protein NL676_005984 [Syzygium grande]|nr:hypothetical protein NL676_005984 [Syzygium grande]
MRALSREGEEGDGWAANLRLAGTRPRVQWRRRWRRLQFGGFKCRSKISPCAGVSAKRERERFGCRRIWNVRTRSICQKGYLGPGRAVGYGLGLVERLTPQPGPYSASRGVEPAATGRWRDVRRRRRPMASPAAITCSPLTH